MSEPGVVERLESESIATLLAELSAKSAKSPRDYFQLAILDGVDPHSDENLEDWLLEGIRNYPREPGLSALFREYLEHHVKTDRLPEAIFKSLKALPGNRFFQLTEPAWDRLIRECNFDDFREVLDRCEQKLTTTSGRSIVIFYLHILKPAIWKADDEWFARLIAEIEDQYFNLPVWAQQELEMLSEIAEYRRSEHVQNESGLLQKMNEAMRQWCLDLEGKSDRLIVDCQHHLAANGTQLLNEFPADKPMGELLKAWNHVIEDVASRQGSVNFEREKVANHAFNFMARTTRRTSRGLEHAIGNWLALVGVGVALFALIVAIMFLVRMALRFMNGLWLSAILDILWSVLTIIGGIIAAYIVIRISRPARRLPYAEIRGELLKLIRVIPMMPHELSSVLSALENKKFGDGDDLMDADEITAHLQADPAMHIYSAAQRILQCEADPMRLVEKVSG
ncbi:hypothetical protein [Mariniblastus fucicola]|uniref:hypothetical protein n=1 Tax=Mariniblastus fucicola TaxID=980251 RepID=UPI0012F7D829|nr:hypothetical protein [Mariniblastus fucicola]